jgi:hypothetical protein
MANNLPNNKKLLSQQNIFLNQSKQPKIKNRKPARDEDSRNVWQDKGVFTNAPHKAGQPDPLTKGSRAQELNNETPRAQKTNPARVKLVHQTLHIHPLVKAELARKSAETGNSISSIGAEALYEWALSSIRRQQVTTLKTELRQIVREELQAFGHRIVFFLMRIAFSAEQARILITNVLKLVVKLTGGDQKSYYSLVDKSGKLAKSNIIANTPQLKTLLEEWDKSEREEEKEVKTT